MRMPAALVKAFDRLQLPIRIAAEVIVRTSNSRCSP